MTEMSFIAHIKPDTKELQSLEEHLKGTAEFAKKFAAAFNNAGWGECLGALHDLGKLSKDFQNYIRANSGYDENDQDDNNGITVHRWKVDHTSAGAIYAKEKFPQAWPPLSYCIAGHHAGLLNWYPKLHMSGDLSSRMNKPELEKIRNEIHFVVDPDCKFEAPCGSGLRPEHIHLWIRMLFSCLVDADYLDTERFMNLDLFNQRGKYDSLSDLKIVFDDYMKKMLEASPNTPVNRIRNSILQQSLSKGEEEPGFFSITVPTGGGKTLSTMAWALVHAIKYKKSRIIFTIPYTSITSQTAKIYREIFGENNVIEHHSNIDEDTFTQERKLATDNWDAPIIVTTNVQLFESLYAKKTSRCRKLHNLVDSIIILDEAQMLPPEFLDPILSVLKGLVASFGASIMFSTATQPALTGKIGNGQGAFTGIYEDEVREIIPDYEQLSNSLRRVEIKMPDDVNVPTDITEIAEELKSYEQCLCIVNTRKECRDLYKLMPEGTLHLSRMMCTSHIMKTIDEIKKRLKSGEPVRVISTQLIEAGVDVDFPVVYRAFSGLDSIAQSAGRCNREGKLNDSGKLGYTKVFISEKQVPPGLMRKGVDAFKDLYYKYHDCDFLSPEMFKKYFELFYSKVNDFDKPQIDGLLVKDVPEMKFQFATAARDFRLIDDNGSQSILVPYNDGAELIELLKIKGPEPWLMRRLQQYSVSVNKNIFTEIVRMQRVEEVHGCYIQADIWRYDNNVGLTFPDEWSEENLIL